VVTDHGGKISVHSRPGSGTTFVIDLPRNTDKLPAEPPTGNQSSLEP
jgi:signal transduction histidine kinase